MIVYLLQDYDLPARRPRLFWHLKEAMTATPGIDVNDWHTANDGPMFRYEHWEIINDHKCLTRTMQITELPIEGNRVQDAGATNGPLLMISQAWK